MPLYSAEDGVCSWAYSADVSSPTDGSAAATDDAPSAGDDCGAPPGTIGGRIWNATAGCETLPMYCHPSRRYVLTPRAAATSARRVSRKTGSVRRVTSGFHLVGAPCSVTLAASSAPALVAGGSVGPGPPLGEGAPGDGPAGVVGAEDADGFAAPLVGVCDDDRDREGVRLLDAPAGTGEEEAEADGDTHGSSAGDELALAVAEALADGVGEALPPPVVGVRVMDRLGRPGSPPFDADGVLEAVPTPLAALDGEADGLPPLLAAFVAVGVPAGGAGAGDIDAAGAPPGVMAYDALNPHASSRSVGSTVSTTSRDPLPVMVRPPPLGGGG